MSLQIKPNGGYQEPIGLLMETVEERAVNWLWMNRVPVGGLTILDGDPGCGKSMLTLELAARVSRGYPFPSEKDFQEPRGVVLLSAEDSLSHVIRPRLRAANADLSRVLAVPYSPDYQGQRTISRLPADVPVIGKAIERVNAKLVVIDVLMAYLPPMLSANRDQDVRHALAPLAELSDALGVAVILIRHLNKNAGVSPLHRGGGSVGIIGAARSGLLLAPDPHNPDSRVIAVVKSNLGAPTQSLGFRIVTEEGVPHIEWTGANGHTADSLLAPIVSTEDKSAKQEAMDFLLEELSTGPVESTKLLEYARKVGINDKTLRRAKDSLGVKAYPLQRKWYWKLDKP